MTEDQDRPRIALVLATWIGLTACGSGTPAEPLLVLPAQSSAAVPAGAVIGRDWVLRNQGPEVVSAVRVGAVTHDRVLQQPLTCVGAGAELCQSAGDGGLVIAQLMPGAELLIHQEMRIAAGFHGALQNQIAVHQGGGVALNVSEHLAVRSSDLSVEIDAPQPYAGGPVSTIRFVARLRNAGPSEALDVQWIQRASPSLRWLGTRCRESGPAQCPASLRETVSGLSLPSGGQLEFELSYQYTGDLTGNSAWISGYLNSEAQALGDSWPADNRAHAIWGQPYRTEGPARILQLDGTVAELHNSWAVSLWRWIEGEKITDNSLMIDPTGTFFFRPDDGLEMLHFGSVVDSSSGLLVGARAVAGRTLVFLGSRTPISDVRTLEGQGFNVMMAQTDRDGRPLSSRVWTARVRQGQFELCSAEPAVVPSACPFSHLKRLNPAWVSGRLELVGAGDVWTLDTALLKAAPVLFGVGEADALGRRWTSIWVPQVANISADEFRSGNLTVSGLGRTEGHELVPLSFRTEADGTILVTANDTAIPNFLFIHYESFGRPCLPAGSLRLLAVPQLQRGLIDSRKEERLCWSGEVWRAQGAGLTVLLGASGGPLQGQWALNLLQ